MTKKLFILAEPRSGSSWLMNTLESHRDIAMLDELYNHSTYKEVAEFHNGGSENFSACIDYLEKKLASTSTKNKKYIGCKILLNQLEFISSDFTPFFIENYKNAVFIFLYRENIVLSQLSLRIAHTHNVWHCNKPGDIKKRYVRLSPHFFLSKLEQKEKTRKKYLQLLKDFKVKKQLLTYEKLFANKHKAIEKICRFLEISNKDITFSKEQKGNPFDPQDIIENYNAIDKALQKFPHYHQMLKDGEKMKIGEDILTKQKRKILIQVILFALLTSFLVFLLCYFYKGDNEPEIFKKNAQQILKKSKKLVQKARNFNQEKALRKLTGTSVNGFYYRFDDFIHKAQIDRKEIKNIKTTRKISKNNKKYLLNWDFNEREKGDLLSTNVHYSISEGLLKVENSKGSYFEKILNIPFNEVGTVEIKSRHRTGKLLRIGWDRKFVSGISKSASFSDIDVIPGKTFHIYRLDAKHVMERKLSSKSRIRKLYLFPSDVDGDKVEIDYIRIISKKGQYLEKNIGTSYETKANEMRKVLHTQTPMAVTYRLLLSGENHVIRFGMGIIDHLDPVEFKVLINGSKEIYSKKVNTPEKWHDAKIKLNSYKGQKIQITFKTWSQKGNIALWANPILFTPSKEKFNVIIVLEDALRADHLSCYGYKRNTTPIKKNFAKKGVLFLNAFSQAAKTRTSCPSFMTSLYPTATRVWKYYESLHDHYLTTAEILRYKGFRTAAFIQNPNAGASTGLHQGYSYLYTGRDAGKSSKELYTKKALQWIKKNCDSNYFLYLHLTDPHSPYNPPKKFHQWYIESMHTQTKLPKNKHFDPQWVSIPSIEGRRARYDGEIGNNDLYFENFIKGLEKLKILEHTLVVFMSDHGEFLGERNIWGHQPPTYLPVIKTPLIMVYPNKFPPNLTITQGVQNLDILPTILDLAKIDRSPLLLSGDSLVPLIFKKNLQFWNHRIIVCDEMHNRFERDDHRQLSSIIYRDVHILMTENYPIQEFKFKKDKDEQKGKIVPHQMKTTYQNFIRNLQKNNFYIWQALTKKNNSQTKFDPLIIKQLRTLGYIE